MRLTWLGHSSVRVEADNHIVYIDPYAGPEEWYTPASAILVSRWHYDHCNMAKLRLASNDGTHILGTPEVASEIFPSGVLAVGEKRDIDGLEIQGMKCETTGVMHRGHDHEIGSRLGFMITAEGKSVFYMGDSDFLEEFANLKPDVLLIAVGGTYTHGPRDAAKAADLINPKLAIPIHYGSVVGSTDDALLFSELASVPVKVLAEGESVTI